MKTPYQPDARGPLNGLRVVDMTRLAAGNMMTHMLADFGAEVIKVERPRLGDDLRRFGEAESWWKVYARSKRSLSLDFKTKEGRDVLEKLIGTADILCENFVPGTLEKWGLGPQDLWTLNDNLIVGFGGVLSAVIARQNGSAKGQVVDLSLFEPLFGILGPWAAQYEATGKVPRRMGNSSDVAAPRNLYPTKDGKHIAMSASMQSMWEKLAHAMGQPELIIDPRFATSLSRIENQADLDAIIAEVMATRTLEENLEYFESQGVTVGPICDIADLIDHPYIRGREVLQDFEAEGMERLPMHQTFPRLSETPGAVRAPAPKLGQDNADILNELGYDPAAQQALIDKGVL
ncbi:Succinyl-CoA--D-citramalate CoA-transferase [Nymphon striatum]|nr:Succinyl-CoA--D-citramalate CoA-transferase [Nymphon striatum]